MKSINTFGIQFIIRVPKNEKAAEATVYARITVNGRRSEISLKKKIDPKFWDEVKGQAKGKRDQNASLNNYIERIRTIITYGYHNLVQQNKAINVDSVKALFIGYNEDAITIKKLFEYHNPEATCKLAPDTMKNYGTTQRYIGKFLRDKYHRHDIMLSELTYRFLLDFENYLRSYVPKDHQQRQNNNSIMKHIERLRKIVNLSIKLDWL